MFCEYLVKQKIGTFKANKIKKKGFMKGGCAITAQEDDYKDKN